MTSRSATVLVIFVVAVIAFCLASVFGAMTGPISILPNESDSDGNSLNNISVVDNTDDSSDSYSNNDYSSSSSSNVETTTDSSSSSSNVETTTGGSSSTNDGSNPSGDSQKVETTIG